MTKETIRDGIVSGGLGLLLVAVFTLVVGCASTTVEPRVPSGPGFEVVVVGEDSDVDPADYADVLTLCRHRYESDRDFRFMGVAQLYRQNLFGREVVNYEFAALGQADPVFLSDAELENYVCAQQ